MGADVGEGDLGGPVAAVATDQQVDQHLPVEFDGLPVDGDPPLAALREVTGDEAVDVLDAVPGETVEEVLGLLLYLLLGRDRKGPPPAGTAGEW